MANEKNTPISSDVLIADLMLRVTSMEKLLFNKGIITTQELKDTTEEIAKNVAKIVLEKAQSSKSVDEFISELKSLPKDKRDLNN